MIEVASMKRERNDVFSPCTYMLHTFYRFLKLVTMTWAGCVDTAAIGALVITCVQFQ